MKYAGLKKTDIANGTGVRVSLWVSGCERRCPGCFNPKAQNFEYGTEFTENTLSEILDALDKSYVKGLTLLGGEPMAERNRQAVLSIVRIVKQKLPNKDIWLYTGYKYEEVSDSPILQYVDILVDGEFIEAQKDLSLKFRGSANQRIIDLNKTRQNGKLTLHYEI